jgi:hypothetical protein
MPWFLSVAVTALAFLASQALGSLESTASPHVAMVRSMFENALEFEMRRYCRDSFLCFLSISFSILPLTVLVSLHSPFLSLRLPSPSHSPSLIRNTRSLLVMQWYVPSVRNFFEIETRQCCRDCYLCPVIPLLPLTFSVRTPLRPDAPTCRAVSHCGVRSSPWSVVHLRKQARNCESCLADAQF